MTDAETPSWSSRPTFDTLDACVEHIGKSHPETSIRAPAYGLDRPGVAEVEMPAFLYRGEVGWVGTCVSRMERIRRGAVPGVTLADVEPLGWDVDRDLQEAFGIGPMLSAGLMQHYGFPTELMDATASLETAACFAQLGAGSERGALAVFDTSILSRNAIVVDLRGHPMAVRPTRQHAFGIFHREHRDLKDDTARRDMGITWYTYRKTGCAAARSAEARRLVAVDDDLTAGILRLWLDDSIGKRGKRAPDAAAYLANRIAHCPLVARADTWRGPGQPEKVHAVTPKEAGIDVDEAREIQESVELWSLAYPDVTRRRGTPEK